MGAFGFMPVHMAAMAGRNNEKVIECPECKGVGYFLKKKSFLGFCIVDHYCKRCDGTGEIKLKSKKTSPIK